MKQMIVCLLAPLLFLSVSYSQRKVEISPIESFPPNSLHVLTDSTGTTGYTLCYEIKDKTAEGKSYVLKTFDVSLNAADSLRFNCGSKENLLAISSIRNGFITLVLNTKKRLLVHTIYRLDTHSQIQYTDQLDVNSHYYLEKSLEPDPDATLPMKLLYPLEGKGFVSIIPTKHKDVFTYDVNIFLQDGSYQRTAYTPPTDWKMQKASFIGATDNLLLLYFFKKKMLATSQYESNLAGIDLVSGQKNFEISTQEEGFPFLPVKVAYQIGQSVFSVLGYGAKGSNKIGKNNQKTLCLLRMDGAGVVLSKTSLPWKTMLNPDDPEETADAENEEAEKEDTTATHRIKRLQVHDFVALKDGGYCLVTEGYKLSVNVGLLIANMAWLGAGIFGNLPIIPYAIGDNFRAGDIVLMRMNSSFRIDSLIRIPQPAHPQFATDFVMQQTASNLFSVAYRDFNFKPNEQQFLQKMVQYQNGTFGTLQEKIVTNAPVYLALPARENELMLAEYFSKKKKVLFSIRPLHP